MKKFFSLILSCFVLPGATVALLLTVAGIARADIINTFNVSGSAVNQTDSSVGSCGAGYACPFSGTLVVDVYEGRHCAFGKHHFPGSFSLHAAGDVILQPTFQVP